MPGQMDGGFRVLDGLYRAWAAGHKSLLAFKRTAGSNSFMVAITQMPPTASMFDSADNRLSVTYRRNTTVEFHTQSYLPKVSLIACICICICMYI